METIKCKECGCVMSVMSEACPMCGTLVDNVMAEEIVQEMEQCDGIVDVDVFDEVSGDWIVPSVNENQVISMVREYNAKAREWGYDELEYNLQSKTLHGAFIAKEEAKGIIERTKEKFRNGYLEEDFDKIIKLCDVKWND